ncbi:AAA family ATPase [Sinorhizobium fredii]|uniref:AAA family ATPase n=1 Tax=Rhizobium fredii TaxID=380 RepID=UPI003514785F
MKFIRKKYPPGESDQYKGVCILADDNWDDFTFKTSFHSTLFDYDGGRYDLGPIKIMSQGMTPGRVQVAPVFEELGASYCSLGADRDYYLKLSGIQETIRSEYLRGISDCVFNPAIWESFKDEEAMQKSLLRGVSARDVLEDFPRVLRGETALTPYAFSYTFSAQSGEASGSCSFRVQPYELPPSNIHVIIGRNGVGKTRLLAGMADALTRNQATSIGIPGRFEFENKFSEGETDFLNLVVVAYSIFDRFDPITGGTERTKEAIPYHYVGIKKIETGVVALKSADDLDDEFDKRLWGMVSDGSRMERWTKALEILESDPGIRDLNLSRLLASNQTDIRAQVRDQFSRLSSGHKIVLLTMTRLVDLVSDRSLVLIDEPETHLHPPLLGSFIRALSDLLKARNGVAILATHSPVVLQEVPAHCVSIIRRSGESVRVVRPEIETFAENVSVLTRRVFGLEVEESGFFKLLSDQAKGRDYDGVMNAFDQKVGGEGRALARALTTKGEGE